MKTELTLYILNILKFTKREKLLFSVLQTTKLKHLTNRFSGITFYFFLHQYSFE